jgi:hypothetical protein
VQPSRIWDLGSSEYGGRYILRDYLSIITDVLFGKPSDMTGSWNPEWKTISLTPYFGPKSPKTRPYGSILKVFRSIESMGNIGNLYSCRPHIHGCIACYLMRCPLERTRVSCKSAMRSSVLIKISGGSQTHHSVSTRTPEIPMAGPKAGRRRRNG